ncbi:D-tagatose 3-epimerase [Rhizobium sp. PP-F2F-G38]|uniref:sugar phosphate isomerase/epimerase family protein n=1 Tax=Rhizobium sp. PP-CC-3G-465 TaxID=2135648 RepID=UPI000D9A59DD|nr:D-tagatose 3-epimerase [Rhizobium sp. PP-WC-1G-195]PYE39507.1 D-tagatose 3-epimerase [Rhizobium sp. PP-F2F-G20b]PYE93331.1 D-tagatose 3-epimerase [Rhizobium sp. PP-F2F-G38]TCP75612.1 D-tagatose 3-epimerase [Rhizobium sp. PP-CC-2G-626]TCQ02542.1 D-tagatose 3-epimerase [Rhizobium sp. PP-F2F-G36]TCQ17240.1 D-tagatose 3-epimerase [Rhizobium sp. PP-CC-3G-465]
MKIGVNTWVWTSPFATADLHILAKAKEMGFDVIEIALEDASIIDAGLLRKIADDNGLGVTICGAFGTGRDISSDDEAVRRNGADYIRQGIDFAAKAGSRLFSGPIYSAVGKTRLVSENKRKQEWAWCVDHLRALGPVASDAGITIGVEPLNRFETDMINLAQQAVALVQEVGSPVYKVHLDTFHANIEEKSIPDVIRTLGSGMLGHFHACENDRGTPGTGHIDWIGIRDALREIGYDGAVVIESFTPGTIEIAKAASIWRPLASSQDELARQGAQFLRSLFGS